MVYLRIKDDSKQAKLMLEYLKTMPFVEVIKREDVPNLKTQKAIEEAEKGDLKRHKTIKSLMKDLND